MEGEHEEKLCNAISGQLLSRLQTGEISCPTRGFSWILPVPGTMPQTVDRPLQTCVDKLESRRKALGPAGRGWQNVLVAPADRQRRRADGGICSKGDRHFETRWRKKCAGPNPA
jgi:hypothetical protein